MRCSDASLGRGHLLRVLAGGLILAGLAARSVVAQQPPRDQPNAVPPAVQAEVAQIASEAKTALGQGDYEGAIRGYEKLVKLMPGVAEFHANLGMALYSAGHAQEAARPLREALKLKPGLSNARYFLDASLAECGQCKEALPSLLKDYPRLNDPLFKRVLGVDGARCAMVLNQLDTAVETLRLLNRDFPNDPDVLYLTVNVHSELSTRASTRLLLTAPGSYQAHQINAESLEIQGKLDDAAAEYHKVLELNPRLTGIHYHLGRILLSGQRDPATLDAARREFEAELNVDPANPEAEYEIGEMARQARQWDEAIGHFSRAVKMEPNFVDAQIGLGKSLVSAGHPADALEPLESAVKLSPGNAVAHYQLSFAYRRVGREKDAETELAAYRQAHAKTEQTMQAIRAGIQGRMTQEQTAEPPE